MIVNITLSIEDYNLVQFENWMRENVDVKDFRVVPNTKELYENDKTFQRLCKAVTDAKKIKSIYINDNNNEQDTSTRKQNKRD